MARYIYRDYRPGHKGQFASKAAYNRSQGQGVECHIHREKIETPDTIESIDDLEEYEDYPDDELFEYEFAGTGDYGRRAE